MLRTKGLRTLDLAGVETKALPVRLPADLLALAQKCAETRRESLAVFVAESLEARIATLMEAPAPRRKTKTRRGE